MIVLVRLRTTPPHPGMRTIDLTGGFFCKFSFGETARLAHAIKSTSARFPGLIDDIPIFQLEIDRLVTHHIAVVGITGFEKSTARCSGW
jgi:hypothetical protein